MSEPKPLPLVVKDLSFRYHTRDSCAIRNDDYRLNPGKSCFWPVLQVVAKPHRCVASTGLFRIPTMVK